ncbi:hypothetical protein [Sphingomonas sp.]|jgi:hypothetical protein|uniref:hypothetical protein n=1 Tax=Sphingomonas sp. TaxID=28214 RepID=UPI002DECDDD6|nr:hypothetical protein [Sphingomonas sp.]
MTAADLRDLFLTTLTRRFGGNRRRWRMVMGEVKLYSRATHPHCNWAVTPSGSASENSAVEAVADDLRAAHPIIG